MQEADAVSDDEGDGYRARYPIYNDGIAKHKVDAPARKKARRSFALVAHQDDYVRRWVYTVTDRTTNKVIYVGQTNNLRGRWKAHEKATSPCKRLAMHLQATQHSDRFAKCEGFPDGVVGTKHANMLESYMIAKYATVYNMKSNPDGCNCTTGPNSWDPEITETVETWIRDGYTEPEAKPLSYIEPINSDFREAVLRDMHDVYRAYDAQGNELDEPGPSHPEWAKELALIVKDRAKTDALNLRGFLESKKKELQSRGTKTMSYTEYMQDYHGPIAEAVELLKDLNRECDTEASKVINNGVYTIGRWLRCDSGKNQHGTLTTCVASQIKEMIDMLAFNSSSGTGNRDSRLASLKAYCRPGWACTPSVEAAIEKTKGLRDNPPDGIGPFSLEELNWFASRIENMHDIEWVKNSAGKRHRSGIAATQ